MRIVSKGTLKSYWLKRPEVEFYLIEWIEIVKDCTWNSPNELKLHFGSASVLKAGRVVFNIKGNSFRLITDIDFDYKIIFIIWIGTHKEYEKINAQKVKYDG